MKRRDVVALSQYREMSPARRRPLPLQQLSPLGDDPVRGSVGGRADRMAWRDPVAAHEVREAVEDERHLDERARDHAGRIPSGTQRRLKMPETVERGGAPHGEPEESHRWRGKAPRRHRRGEEHDRVDADEKALRHGPLDTRAMAVPYTHLTLPTN